MIAKLESEEMIEYSQRPYGMVISKNKKTDGIICFEIKSSGGETPCRHVQVKDCRATFNYLEQLYTKQVKDHKSPAPQK